QQVRQSRRWAPLLAASAFLFLGACASPASPEAPPAPSPAAPASTAAPPADDYDGIQQIHAAQLAAACTIAATSASIAVADGETLSVSYRASDGKVTLNASTGTGAPCDVAATSTLKVTASGTEVSAGRSVILDYTSGLYMKGVGATPGIVIDLTVG